MLRADVYLRLPTPHPSPLPRTGRMADDAARRPTLVGRRPAAAGGRGEAHAETGKAHRLRKGQVQGIARYAYLLARRLLARAVRSFPRCTQTRSHVHGLMDLVVLEGLVGLSFPFYLCSPMYHYGDLAPCIPPASIDLHVVHLNITASLSEQVITSPMQRACETTEAVIRYVYECVCVRARARACSYMHVCMWQHGGQRAAGCVCVCVCARARASVRACVRACV